MLDDELAPAEGVAEAVEVKAIDWVNEKPLEEDCVVQHHALERHRIVTVPRIGQQADGRVRRGSINAVGLDFQPFRINDLKMVARR